ncbi:hypothetical protein FOA52_007369 [Chlamydomonas sp. UWO 241]|nr:hypothetical protein FOA52_007369 [Chlamydomonas sp. UWO 241]
MAPAKKPAAFCTQGVTSLGRSQTYKRRALFALKKKNGGKFPVHAKKAAPAPAASKAPRFYPADDVSAPLAVHTVRKPTKLRASITPGTVLILLAGRFKGKRCVCLGQLPSGLLLITGPFKLNGVPVRRVSQTYVIATSTKVTLPTVDVSKFTDTYFKPTESKRAKGGDAAFFEEPTTKAPLPADYVANQKALDAALLPALTAELKSYLASRFTLRDGDRPHLMKF